MLDFSDHPWFTLPVLPSQPDLESKAVGTDVDRVMMRRCLELARSAQGRTAPNPMVGSVIVHAGHVIGEGFHPGAGQPHAEVFALRAARDRARGATLYVNLEPCNHYGRTPPCSEAVIAAGIEKVVVGMVDPNPLVAGTGIARLRDTGIDVIVGVEEAACQALNEAFVHRILHQRPLGILKYAMTLDGKIATNKGHSAWITSNASRQVVHGLRRACDAVIVGSNTVRHDNPRLTSRLVNAHHPLRVVMSRSLDLPLSAHLWDISQAPTLVFTKPGANPEVKVHLQKEGVEVQELEMVSPVNVMQSLYERGCSAVLWECGGTLSAPAIAQQAIQKIYAFIAPKIVGGQQAPSPVHDLGIETMVSAIQLEHTRVHLIESDILIEGYLPKTT
jgi:diaminohydroxyphosphoribosylaminopyrimidine deaminase / 5-amino-6-(5-phosphoribosylamino)uracil reductase